MLLSFELALRVQACLIVAALAAAAWGNRRSVGRAVRLLPGPVRVGLGLYASAAVWGLGVGLLAGNPVRFVASQFLSLALLPAAAVAFAARDDLDGETFVRGMGWAALVALVLHGAGLAVPGFSGDLPGHFGFELRNGAGLGGVAPLLLLLGLARAGAGWHWWLIGIPGVAAILCLGTQLRGAWVSVLLGSLLLLLLMTRRWSRAVALASGVGLLAAAATLAAAALGGRAAIPEEPFRLDSAGTEETEWQIAPWRTLDGAAVEVSIRSRGERGAHLWVWIELAQEDGRRPERAWLEVVGSGRWTATKSIIAAPPGTTSCRAGFMLNPGERSWLVDRIGLEAVPSRLEGLGRQLALRALSLGPALTDPVADSSLSYRIAEARVAHAEWRRAGSLRRLVGLGLGATFGFPSGAFDAEGRRSVVPRSSYIHSFYLFLLLKLGLAGVLALSGLFLVVGWTARSALTFRGRPERQWLLAGATAGWLTCLIWSLTSPVIYEFRLSPLWGILVVACCREVERTSAPRGSAVVPRTPDGGPATLTVERLGSEAALSSLQPEWDSLLAASRSRTIALTWGWLSTWWEVFGDRRELALLTVRDASGLLVGLAPFALVSGRVLGPRRLELLGTGEARADEICSEYLDVIARRDREDEVVGAIADHLARTWRSGWDEVVMGSVLPGSAACALVSAMARRGFQTASSEMGRCPNVPLPEKEDAVRELLSPTTRRKLAYYARNLAQAGGVELATCRNEPDLDAAMVALAALHGKRWNAKGESGCFASERFAAFHRRIAGVLLREGRLVLYSLTVGGATVYVVYGFRDGTRILGYQSGFDPDFDPRVSLGLVMYDRCLRQAVSEGAREWDFLRGEEAYKAHWATGSRTILSLHVWNTGPRAALSRLAFLARGAARRAASRLGARKGGQSR